MAKVQSARGLVDSSHLGATLMHEHVFVLDPEIQQNYFRRSGVAKKSAFAMPSRD